MEEIELEDYGGELEDDGGELEDDGGELEDDGGGLEDEMTSIQVNAAQNHYDDLDYNDDYEDYNDYDEDFVYDDEEYEDYLAFITYDSNDEVPADYVSWEGKESLEERPDDPGLIDGLSKEVIEEVSIDEPAL